MIRLNRVSYLIFIMMLGLFILSCAQLGIQSKKETPDPSSLPECKKNYTKEGIWPINRVYKTWVKYSPLDHKKAFDTALMALKPSGYRRTSAERESGIINAEIIPVIEGRKPYPVEIKLVKEKGSITVHLSSPSATDDSGKECFCNFYDEFEKSMKRSQPAPVAKQASPPPKKAVEPEKDSSTSSPPPSVETRKTSSSPAPPPKPLPKTEVAWGTVNLREGPGMKYKVVGKVTKGASLAVLEEKEGWLHIRLESGKEAWISKSATSEGAKAQPASTPSPAPVSSPSPSAAPESPKPISPM
jgi:hypothetical protein